jgi:hypothetical protein
MGSMTATPPSSSRPPAPHAVAIAALTIAALAIGFFIGRSTTGTTPVSDRFESSASSSLDFGPVVAELHQINEALRQRSASVDPSSQRDPAVPGSAEPRVDPSEQLVAVIDKLNRTLESRSAVDSAAHADDSRWKGPGYPSLDTMWDHILEQVRQAHTPGDEGVNARDAVVSDLCRAHFLWARGDVPNRYGTPDFTSGESGGLNFYYFKKLKADDTASIIFKIQNGIVTTVDVQ